VLDDCSPGEQSPGKTAPGYFRCDAQKSGTTARNVLVLDYDLQIMATWSSRVCIDCAFRSVQLPSELKNSDISTRGFKSCLYKSHLF